MVRGVHQGDHPLNLKSATHCFCSDCRLHPCGSASLPFYSPPPRIERRLLRRVSARTRLAASPRSGLRRALPAVTPCAPPQDYMECGLHVPVPVLRSYVTTPGIGHINAAYHSQRPTHRLLPSIARYASDGGTADA